MVGRKLGERARERGLQHGIAFRVGRREGSQMNLVVEIAEDGGRKAADQAVGAVGDRVEHRLHVGGRGGDDLQNLGGGGLPLQRFASFVEQPRVLDRNHSLIGEGLQQLNMMGGKCAGLGAGDADDADRCPLVHQRGEQHAAEAAQPPEFLVGGRHVVGLGIGELNGRSLTDQRKGRKFGEWPRERRPQRFVRRGIGWRIRHQMKLVADETQHRGRERAEQAFCAIRDGRKHRLHVRRRTGDDLQDLGRRGLPLQRLLRLVEQPCVLDRDHSLVGEGLQQLDVMVGERAGLNAGDADLPYRHALVHQRCEQHAAVATCPRNVPDLA